MHHLTCEFLQAAFDARQFPALDLPEVAFVGRSNVGKSSLLNALIGQKGLAKVSATPGRTQSINFFMTSGKWLLVDVPGYGFARVPPSVQASWQQLVDAYLLDRPALQGIVQIVDIRLEPQASDVQMLEFLLAHEIPVMIVATKADKVGRNEADRNLTAWAKLCGISRDMIVKFSAVTGEGRENLWHQIYELLSSGEAAMRERRKQRELERLALKSQPAEAAQGEPSEDEDEATFNMPVEPQMPQERGGKTGTRTRAPFKNRMTPPNDAQGAPDPFRRGGSKPGASRHESANTASPRAAAPKPGGPKAGGPRSGASNPRASKAGSSKPEATRSGESRSGESRSGESRSGESRSGESRAGGPKSGAPRSGTHKSGAPRSGAPRSGAPSSAPNKAGSPPSSAARTEAPQSGPKPSKAAPQSGKATGKPRTVITNEDGSW